MMVALEEAVMEIIVNAGQSRSLCFEALHAARQGNLDEAKTCCAKPMATRARRTRCKPN
jgi:cellobiose-specific phosphotransferase system component IIA